MTVHLFVTADNAAVKLDQGSKQDTGIFPKRTRNVNAWYLVPDPGSTTGSSGLAYPTIRPGTAPHTTLPSRIGIAYTTACPIFRAQDNGSTNPLLIG